MLDCFRRSTWKNFRKQFLQSMFDRPDLQTVWSCPFTESIRFGVAASRCNAIFSDSGYLRLVQLQCRTTTVTRPPQMLRCRRNCCNATAIVPVSPQIVTTPSQLPIPIVFPIFFLCAFCSHCLICQVMGIPSPF